MMSTHSFRSTLSRKNVVFSKVMQRYKKHFAGNFSYEKVLKLFAVQKSNHNVSHKE